MRQSEKRRSGTTACSAALILAFLSGCAAPISNAIPQALTEPCAQPELNGSTYADVIRLAARQRDALAECNERLRTIKRLNEDIKK